MMQRDDYKLLKQPDNFLNRVSQSLNRPIQSRCAELTVLSDRGSMKDLHTVFPLLVDNIFGPHGTVCWELRSITANTNRQDFQALQHFLSPLGPMFKIIYTLLRDPQLKFEFNLGYLPGKIRQTFDGNTMHPFYADLIHSDPQTNNVISLMLNPFDYYFFHFAYHLINPYHQRTFMPTWSTVYYVLCCDYVIHFLPTNPSCLVLPVLNFYNGKNPIYMLPSLNKPSKASKLFRTETLSLNKTQTLEHHPRNEIWRSETIMTVFIDMWLNNDQVISGYQNFHNRGLDSSFNYYRQKLQVNELPTGEYIRIVRVLVKQLHAFSASAKADDTHMGELKKIVIPYLQGRMYVFLRHLVHRWPLDGSFRLVLELWLSFLQPWRYPGNEYLKAVNQQDLNPDLEEISVAPMKAVDNEHMQFMAENLLAYTVILQQLLPRFTRIELSSPKIALILYRLSKVFAQPNLVTFLHEIEECAEDVGGSPLHSYTANTIHNTLPPLSPTTMWSTNFTQNLNQSYQSDTPRESWNSDTTSLNGILFDRKPKGKWNNLIKQKILEFEGPTFTYKPIFCMTPAPEVNELIRHVERSRCLAIAIIDARIKEIRTQNTGFFASIKSFFLMADNSNDEFTLEERKRVPVYLECALHNLMEMFNITLIEKSDVTPQQLQDDLGSTSKTTADINYMLTPKQVRERVKNIRYEGDPDLHPIRSDEVKILVRVLYQLAMKINEDFGDRIQDLYYRDTFLGKLSRQLVQPPITIHKYNKSVAGSSPRQAENLPPRISLRYLASQKFLFYAIMAIILSKLLGYGYFTFIFIGFILWFMYTCLKAICDPGRNQDNVHVANGNLMDSDNLSSNESF